MSEGSFPAANPLANNSELYAAALEHSTDMANSNTFSHDGSGTTDDVTGSNLGHASTFIERIDANGYVGYTTIGENIAGGQTSIEDVVHAWLESPAHCKNIMNPLFKEMGLARVDNGDYTPDDGNGEENGFEVYWSHEFGAKP